MGPYPTTIRGNRFLIVATDIFSKWVEARALPDAKKRNILVFLEDVCQRWGYPEATITDNGASFRSAAWKNFHERNHISSYVSPIYHQRANPVERRNQEIKKLLRVHLRGKTENRWDEVMGTVLFTLRNRTNAATGMSPSEALLGEQLSRPGEWAHPEINKTVDNKRPEREARLTRVRARQDVYVRKIFPRERSPPRHFNIGDQVLVRVFTGTPFSATWTGPHPVVKVLGNNVYEVDRNGAQNAVHLDDLRPLPTSDSDLDDDEDNDPDDHPPEEIELSDHDDIGERREPQPGPSTRPPDPREFDSISQSSSSDEGLNLTFLCPQIIMEDLPDDHGDLDEAQPILSGTPIVGLYP